MQQADTTGQSLRLTGFQLKMKDTNKQVSMGDIALHLGLSRATVSYVLNERENTPISESTRNRVLEAARHMGYQPNRAAQTLKGRPSHLIELCINDFRAPFYGLVQGAFQCELTSTPYQLHIVNPGHSRMEDWNPSTGGTWPVDGLIVCDAYFPGPVIPALKARGVPIVTAGIYPNQQTDHVFVDLSPALLEAMHHLIAKARRVAFVSMWFDNGTDVGPDPRYPAYRDAMAQAGLPEELIVTPDSRRESVREIVRQYIQKNGHPGAIFCFNDERVIATLAALRDLGLRVPDDVLLIGCDGIEDTIYHHPPLSTIQYPFDKAARLAWEMLQHRMKHPNAPLQSVTLIAQLLFRESSARDEVVE